MTSASWENFIKLCGAPRGDGPGESQTAQSESRVPIRFFFFRFFFTRGDATLSLIPFRKSSSQKSLSGYDSPHTFTTNRASTGLSANQLLVSGTGPVPTIRKTAALLSCGAIKEAFFDEKKKKGKKRALKRAPLTHLVVRFIVHFRVSQRERRVGPAGQAGVLPR